LGGKEEKEEKEKEEKEMEWVMLAWKGMRGLIWRLRASCLWPCVRQS
jgi:hypothetical protein